MIKNKTMKKELRTICSQCGKEHRVIIYPVVSVQNTPELVEKFTKEWGMLEKCPHCGHPVYYTYPIYYADIDNGYWLVYGEEEIVEMMLDKFAEHRGVDISKWQYAPEVKLQTFTSWNHFAAKVQWLSSRRRKQTKYRLKAN